ncbi:MAG: hypothetical protein Q8K65_04390 [Alphaproteobacteria bacterium]|nr:hypothetical protein [Alphaproteobacteria bacterium]
MSSSIESKLEQIEQSIREELKNKRELGSVARTFAIIGAVCLAGVVLVKAPIFLLGAAAAGTGFAVTSWMRGKCEARLDSKYQTQATLMIAQEGARKGQEPSAGMSPEAGLKTGFAQNANNNTPDPDRVEKLAETVEELRQQVEGKPAPLDKPKTLFKGFRRDK